MTMLFLSFSKSSACRIRFSLSWSTCETRREREKAGSVPIGGNPPATLYSAIGQSSSPFHCNRSVLFSFSASSPYPPRVPHAGLDLLVVHARRAHRLLDAVRIREARTPAVHEVWKKAMPDSR